MMSVQGSVQMLFHINLLKAECFRALKVNLRLWGVCAAHGGFLWFHILFAASYVNYQLIEAGSFVKHANEILWHFNTFSLRHMNLNRL